MSKQGNTINKETSELKKEINASTGKKAKGVKKEYIRARILWPALGFPEVIAPKDPVAVMNGTNCIELLLLTDKDELLRTHVSRFLRYTPWNSRYSRYLEINHVVCSFQENDIAVKKVEPENQNDCVQQITFANGHVVANLSKFVREFYDNVGLKHLYQIRILEEASSKLPHGLYNLFWVNRDKKSTLIDISAEMYILKKHFADVRKIEKKSQWWRGEYPTPLPEEYEYNYGKKRSPENRTEVFHPLFVLEQTSEKIRIGHMTDTHICIRADMFEVNLEKARVSPKQYNNYNTRFMELYFMAKRTCDTILLTGDIIDYSCGYMGRNAPIGKIKSYQLDRNWILFYSLLASGNNYVKPTYTVLGNHDYNLNPYPPLTLPFQSNQDMNLTREELETIHGEGADNWFTYGRSEAQSISEAISYLPMSTSIDSIKWYLLLINPFLDYSARFPGKYSFLLLDWAENTTTPQIDLSEVFKNNVTVKGLPVAEVSLTDFQKTLVNWFVKLYDSAKVMGLHASLMGPWPDMPSDQLSLGLLNPCPLCNGIGKSTRYSNLHRKYVSGDCKCTRLIAQIVGNTTKHPVTAINIPPKVDTDINNACMPVYGAIYRNRDWLIEILRSYNISLVLSGHAHRNTTFVMVDVGHYGVPGNHQLIQAYDNKIDVAYFITPNKRKGGFVPPGTAVRICDPSIFPLREPQIRPLFVNTTSAGPMGDDRPTKNKSIKLAPGYSEILLCTDGTIEAVEYKKSDLKMFCWECVNKKKSKANYVKLHTDEKSNKCGIIAGYDLERDAIAENGADSPWFIDGKEGDAYADYECWVRKPSTAIDVKIHRGEIIGVYETKEEAEAEVEQGEPWQKWNE